MATVFISYSHSDKATAAEFTEFLRANGHTVFLDLDLYSGDDWRKQLSEKLSQADVFIVLLSNVSVSSAYPMAEVGRALSLAEQGKMLIIPIAIDDVKIPTLLQDRLVLRAEVGNLDNCFLSVLLAIDGFEERRKEQALRLEEVRQDLSEFVDEAIRQQREYEKSNRQSAVFWQFLGVASLVLVLVVAGVSVNNALTRVTTPEESRINLTSVLSVFAINVVVIGVMAALARYSYSLAKSYMSESLKSADRVHAIQFGKFFLKAYGARLSPAEVKEAFQHWNIDRNSTFATLDPTHIDPQIYSLISQLVGAVSSRK